MLSQKLIRWSGPATMLGGVLWIVGTVVTALKPEGCIGAACALPGRSMRAGSSLDSVVFIAALLLIGLGVAGMVSRARCAGRLGRLGQVGLVGGGGGVALLLTGGLVQALLFGNDFPSMPLVVIPGGLALVIGVLLLGFDMLRVGVLPRWSGALLILGTLALLGVNDQNAQVLMAIPFGIAWVGAAYALWSNQGESPAQG